MPRLSSSAIGHEPLPSELEHLVEELGTMEDLPASLQVLRGIVGPERLVALSDTDDIANTRARTHNQSFVQTWALEQTLHKQHDALDAIDQRADAIAKQELQEVWNEVAREEAELTERMSRLTNSHRASAYATAAALREKLAVPVDEEEHAESYYEAGPDVQHDMRQQQASVSSVEALTVSPMNTEERRPGSAIIGWDTDNDGRIDALDTTGDGVIDSVILPLRTASLSAQPSFALELPAPPPPGSRKKPPPPRQPSLPPPPSPVPVAAAQYQQPQVGIAQQPQMMQMQQPPQMMQMQMQPPPLSPMPQAAALYQQQPLELSPVDLTGDPVPVSRLEPANLKRPAPADRLNTSDGESSPLPHYLQVELRAGARDMLRHDLMDTAAAVELEAVAPPGRFGAEAAAAVVALQAEETLAEAAVEAEAEEWTTGRGVSLERTVTSRCDFQWKNPDFLLKNRDFLLKNVDL